MSRKLLIIGALFLGLAPGTALSLGLGEIRLDSYLNQPLDAQIALSIASAEELGTLRVELASAEAFSRYGLTRPAYFDDLRFQVRRTGPSSAVLQVTSSRPMVEPFLTFLVEARWNGGRMLREYTVLLDPPVFVPGATTDTAPAPAPAPAPAAEPPVAAPRAAFEPAEPTRTTPPAAAPAAPAAPAAQPDYGNEYGPVQRNETLWAIAQRVRPDPSLSTNQVMMALFRANPHAFDGNINRLRAGVVLRLPSRQEMAAASVGETNVEVRRHMDEWRATAAVPTERRLELAPPSETPRAAPEPLREPTAAAPSRELLQTVEALREELSDTRRLVELKDAEIAALQAQLAEREAAMEPGVAPTEPAAETVPDSEGEAAVEAEPEAVPAAVEPPPTRVAAPPPPPSLLDRALSLLGSIWLWLVLALVLIAAAVVLFLRKRGDDDRSIEADLAETGTWARLDAPGVKLGAAVAAAAQSPRRATPRDGELESILVEERGTPGRAAPATPPLREPEARPAAAPRPAAPRAAEHDETRGEEEFQYPFEDTIAGETGINLDQSDPLAEADFHMAYGLYDQAAEIIKKAVEREPDRYDLRRKLIDICFVWGNADEFLAQAKAIKAMRGGSQADDWGKVAIMGRQICPGEPLFVTTDAASVDIELGEESQPAPQLGEEETPSEQWLDFDVGESDEPLQALGDTREQPGLDVELPPPTERTAELNLEELGIDLDLGETGEHALQDIAERAPEIEDETGEFKAGFDLPELPDSAEEDEGGTLMMDTSAMQRASESPTSRGVGWQEDEDEPTVSGMSGYDEQDDESDHTAIKKALPSQEAPTAEVGGFAAEGDADLDLDDLTQALKAGLEEAAEEPQDEAVTQLAPGIRPPEGYDDEALESPPRELDEVGTKLDLARAYIDMGDPDGARSILEEALEEGDASQQAEARQLLDSLA